MRNYCELFILLLFALLVTCPSFSGECVEFFEAVEHEDFSAVFRYSLQKRNPLGGCTNNLGENALHIFAKGSGNQDIYAALYHLARVDINATNHLLETPLMYAAQSGNHAVAFRILSSLERRPHLNVQDKNGNTALHLAAMHGNGDVIATLLAFGARKDILNNEEKSYVELFQAYQKKQAEQAEALRRNPYLGQETYVSPNPEYSIN